MLVSAKLWNNIGLLQTELSNRERHEARGVGHEALPLVHHMIGCHSKREAGVERCPDPVHDLLEVTDQRQHRQDRLHEDADLPLPPSLSGSNGEIFNAKELALTPQ